MGWFQQVMDWRQVKHMKAGLLSALAQTPPGAGISVKTGVNKDDPGDRILARAVIELLTEKVGELEIMDYGFEITIMRKIGMIQSMTRESHEALTANHNILTAESVRALGLKGSDQLPARRWRGGVPDTVNGEGPHQLEAPSIIITSDKD